MTKEDILDLADMARIRLSESEAAKLTGEVDAILEYVSDINEIVADSELTKKVGPVHNVWRDDEVTNEPGTFTKDLVEAFPDKQNNYLKVKKILNTDS